MVTTCCHGADQEIAISSFSLRLFNFKSESIFHSVLMAADTPWRGMADELQELHYLKDAQFINQLKLIIYHGEFHLVEGEINIYSAISEQSEDFDNLINAARKAVEHGYRVYILPCKRYQALFRTEW